ncbi:uncharacterized protein V2V93DRAFT_375251 [Kockiozyma suomiensis]|uniref:uncharacterized protein n=1 Tax=Kockiozyma suomiensis TaxID=1337062 RepID=UPI0033434B03
MSDFAALWAGIAPEQQPRGVVGGLVNTGNSCFLNAVVQALASSSCLEAVLASARDSPLCSELFELLSLVNARIPSQHSHSTAALLKAMHSPRWTQDSATAHQQDSHEFLLALLDCLRGALPKDTVLPFDGQLESHVSCLGCSEQQPVRAAPFSSLELALPNFSPRPVSLESMLEAFVAPEEIDSVYCQRCSLVAAREHLQRLLTRRPVSDSSDKPDIWPILRARFDAISRALLPAVVQDADFERLKPPRLVAASKRRHFTVRHAPENLVVHVNRSHFDPAAQVPRKNSTAVSFPEFLDFKKYMTVEDSVEMPSVYRLASVVVHFGSHSMGHYITYRRCPDTQTWTRISDKDVRDASVEEVLSQGSVSMLLYEQDHSGIIPLFPPKVSTCTAPTFNVEPERIHIPLQSPSRISLAELISIPVTISSPN